LEDIMRFSDGALGRRILGLPGGKHIISLGRSFLDWYYWLKYLRIGELWTLLWAIRHSENGLTRRAMTRRLRRTERLTKYVAIHLSCARGLLLVRPATTDVSVVKEVFYREEYRPIRGWFYRSVLDCGANGGIFAAYAQIQGGSGLNAYIGVEPDPDSFALLTEQVSVRGIASISTLMRVAVSDHDGVGLFDISAESWGHRLNERGTLEVQTLTVNSILDRAGLKEVDLLKLDIEGGEKQVLEAMPLWRDRVKSIVVELHDVGRQHLDFEWFSALARASGYDPMPVGTLFHGLPGAVRQDIGRVRKE
jgi:FkbM family methyltransferase